MMKSKKKLLNLFLVFSIVFSTKFVFAVNTEELSAEPVK